MQPTRFATHRTPPCPLLWDCLVAMPHREGDNVPGEPHHAYLSSHAAYDAQGRVSGMTVNGVALVNSITYHPFGLAKSWMWNGGSLQTSKRRLG